MLRSSEDRLLWLRFIFILLGLLLVVASACDDTDSNRPSAAGGERSSGDTSQSMPPIGGRSQASKPTPEERRAFPIDPENSGIQWPSVKPTAGSATAIERLDFSLPLESGEVRAGPVKLGDSTFTSNDGRCRAGDFRLENAVVSLCIQGKVSFSPVSENGGNIIDARLTDRPGTDEFIQMLISADLGEVDIKHIGVVRDGKDGGPAVLRVEGLARGLRLLQGLAPGTFPTTDVTVLTEYRLEADSDTVEILTWVVGDYKSGNSLRLYDLLFFGDQTALLSWPDDPFAREWSAAEGLDVSYAYGSRDGTYQDFLIIEDLLPAVAIEHGKSTIALDEAAVYRRWFKVGAGDIESVRPHPENSLPLTMRGQPRTRVSIISADGLEVTRAQLNETGERTVQLIPGSYLVKTVGYPTGDTESTIDLVDKGDELLLDQVRPGRLRVTVSDQETGNRLAARLQLNGPKSQLVNVIDETTLVLAPGEWRGVVTRGWHYDIAQTTFTVVENQTVELNVTLKKVIDTPGWASGDFHQHASPSLDSERPVTELVRANMAEGLDFMVPSDHDIVEDYSRVAKRLGFSDRIGTPLTGIEVSPTFAHFGAYGQTYSTKKAAGGGPPLGAFENDFWRAMEVPELVEWTRQNGAQFIQVNHPRGSQSYFEYVDYESGDDIKGLDPQKWTSDFQAIEVFNGQSDFCAVLADWWGLLNQGLKSTAIGNSDTHKPSVVPGYPRNYLPTQAQKPSEITSEEVVAGIRNGVVTVGGGAVIDFPDGPQPGDTVERASPYSIRVRLRTPPFARVDRLLAYFNGKLLWEKPVSSEVEDIVDMDEVVSIEVPRDGHLIFLALGEPSLEFIKPGHTVFALSNPIWLDTDGSGISHIGPGPVTKPEFSFCR